MRAVQHTTELDRILRLPTRTRDSDDLIIPLSQYLTRPHTCSKRCADGVQTLLPQQAQMLIEAHDRRGAFWQAPIGTGKTLGSLLLPTVFEAKRALLIVPGSLKEKTILEMKRYREHWRIVPFTIVTYEFLSNEDNANYLTEYRPDLVVLDECQRIKNHKSACHRRLKRYRAEHPDVPFCFMSGTPAKRSIRDIAPAMLWAMRDYTPLPTHESDLEDWALVLDADVPDRQRVQPGALRVFGNNLKEIRQGVRARIFSTPGAIASPPVKVDAELHLTLRDLPLTSKEDEHFRTLYEEWQTPDGHTFSDAVALWRYARQLALGFYGVWDPKPPQDWLDARKEWHAGVREFLSHSRKLDTEKQVASYVDANPRHHLAPVLARWRRLKNTFTPTSVPYWTGSTALENAARWVKDGGIVWVEHVPFGQKLSEMTGVPFFSEGGLTADGRHFIQTYEGRSVIASWHACGTGYNLQRWDRGLITSMTPTAILYDQTMGRQHRQRQKSAKVTFDVPISCREQLAGFERAREEDAQFHVDLLAIPSRLWHNIFRSERLTQRGYAWTGKQKKQAA